MFICEYVLANSWRKYVPKFIECKICVKWNEFKDRYTLKLDIKSHEWSWCRPKLANHQGQTQKLQSDELFMDLFGCKLMVFNTTEWIYCFGYCIFHYNKTDNTWNAGLFHKNKHPRLSGLCQTSSQSTDHRLNKSLCILQFLNWRLWQLSSAGSPVALCFFKEGGTAVVIKYSSVGSTGYSNYKYVKALLLAV